MPDIELVAEAGRGIIKTLEKNGYVEIIEKQIERNPFVNKKIQRDTAHLLNSEQQEAFNRISKSEYKEFLIYGITGSR